MKLISRLLSAGCLTIAAIAPAFAATDLLTRGEIYRLINQAQLLPYNRPSRPAKLQDNLVPQDAIRTAKKSRAELLFNEGSLARIGSNAVFRFIPGMRGFQLRNGVALITSPPSSTATKIETLDGQAIAEFPPTVPPPSPDSEGYQTLTLAMVIEVDAAENATSFYNLTNNPIKIIDSKGNSIFIRGGETIRVLRGELGKVQIFNLQKFLSSSALAIGLGIGQESLIQQEPPRVQDVLRRVRVATLAALNSQARLLEGLCTLNARGGASTLRTNCITTDSDDPLRRFQDRRDLVTPPQDPVATPQPSPDIPSPSPVTPSPELPSPSPVTPSPELPSPSPVTPSPTTSPNTSPNDPNNGIP